MAATPTWDEVRELASFRAESGCAISLYVDLEPSVAATPADVQRRAGALLDEAARLEACRRGELTREQSLGVREDLERARQYVEKELERDGAHGLALFADSRDALWEPLMLPHPVADAVRVDSDLYLVPLVPLVENGDGTLVVHVGRELGRLYAVSQGRLVQIGDQSETQPRRHDQGGWSQANYQRHIDTLAHAHLREVVEAVEAELRRRRGADVVFAGSDDTRAELEPLLPAAVQASVAGWTRVEAHAGAAELQEAVAPVLAARAAERDRRLLERWRESPTRSAAGWEETLAAASDGRVDILLYDPARRGAAWRCPRCGRAQAQAGACALDGAVLEQHADGLDLAVRLALAHGGKAAAVGPDGVLEAAGGIAALLRY